MDPPCFWRKQSEEEPIWDRYSPWNFNGTVAWDVIDGNMTDDPIVRDNLVKVARLRGWLECLEFALVLDT